MRIFYFLKFIYCIALCVIFFTAIYNITTQTEFFIIFCLYSLWNMFLLGVEN